MQEKLTNTEIKNISFSDQRTVKIYYGDVPQGTIKACKYLNGEKVAQLITFSLETIELKSDYYEILKVLHKKID